MRVAFFQYFPGTLWTPGGGETQLAKTKEALERQGVEVVLFDPWSRSQDFDVLHIFGSNYELSSFVKAAKGLDIPVVVSVIAYSNKPRWQWFLWRQLDRFMPLPTTYRQRQDIYTTADVLVVAPGEAEQLCQGFSIDPAKLREVPHGIDRARFEQADPSMFEDKFGIKNFVLQVSRILNYKGQTRLIKALEGEGIPLVFIGPLDPVEDSTEFLALVEKHDWVHYLGSLDRDDPMLASAYAAARVHAQPSTIEFPGLVSMEAAAAGAGVVSGKYPTLYAYLGDRILYCDPLSIDSIRENVLKAYKDGQGKDLRKYVLENLSWDSTAQHLISVYQEVLKCE